MLKKEYIFICDVNKFQKEKPAKFVVKSNPFNEYSI